MDSILGIQQLPDVESYEVAAVQAGLALHRNPLVFPRRKRLKRVVFPSALKSGPRVSSSNFTATMPKGVSGYAVVVSKKVSHLSVTRHRIKRRVFSALRILQLPPALILFPKASVADMTYQDIQKELVTLLSKIR